MLINAVSFIEILIHIYREFDCRLSDVNYFNHILQGINYHHLSAPLFPTRGENDICADKIRNNFGVTKLPISLRYFDNKIGFLHCSWYSYRSSNFVIAIVFAHNLFALFFVTFLQIRSWFLFCIAHSIVIALPKLSLFLAFKEEK